MKRIFFAAVIASMCAQAEPRNVTMTYAEYTNIVARLQRANDDVAHMRALIRARNEAKRREAENYAKYKAAQIRRARELAAAEKAAKAAQEASEAKPEPNTTTAK